ncbi:MAG: sugar ABC transporter ATP-binding protein [Leadbetterella sp.]
MKLKLRNISKSYGIVRALQNVDFELNTGEVHAICGENGAGKSTLMNVLSGNVSPDTGEIWLDNTRQTIRSQAHAASLGIAIVYQQLSLFENQTVAENIFVNQFPKTKLGWIDETKLHADTQELLNRLQISESIQANQNVGELSAGQKQMVEIAKALSRDSSILILDEPTASISESDKNTLFKILNFLRKQGTSIIYISHRMEEIFEIADRVTVFKDGKYVSTQACGEITKEQLIGLMVGRELSQSTTKTAVGTEVICEVQGLSNSYIHDISFTIKKGEILALAGLVGAGRTEIAKTIFGVLPIQKGSIRLHGKELSIQSPADAIKNKIAYVPEERKALGLYLRIDIAQNIDSINYTENDSLYYNATKATGDAEVYKTKLNIACSSVNQTVSELSGGNQQKVVLSKWLSSNPDLLIIDEPTHGIDIGAKFEIYELLQKLASEGKSILLISSELTEILNVSDRVLVIKKGRVNKELITSQTNEQEILAWAM